MRKRRREPIALPVAVDGNAEVGLSYFPLTAPSLNVRLRGIRHTIWPRSTSLTGTYTLHAARGNYLSLSLGYGRGAAISPRVADTLMFTVNWSLYL